MRTLVFDIETDGFIPEMTKIHSLVIKDYSSGELWSYKGNQIEKGIRRLEKASCIVGHNIIDFDIPAIFKLYPSFKPQGIIRDTLVLSRLIFTDLETSDWKIINNRVHEFPKKLIARHSLKAWGYRLGMLKGTYAEETENCWEKWTPAMQKYCEQDVHLTSRLYYILMKEDFSEESIKLEHNFAISMSLQQLVGIKFSIKKAEKLRDQLIKDRKEYTKILQVSFPPIRVKKRISKVNNFSKGWIKGQPVYETVLFNPNSPKQLIARLKEKGWIPTEMTTKGNPKVDEETLKGVVLEGVPMDAIIDLLTIKKRLGQLATSQKAWLKVVKEDGRIYGSINTGGAVTGRCTHSDPNLAQVPKCGSKWYGSECRGLFQPSAGMVMVGCDASGLELRCLAHFLFKYDNGLYGKIITQGKNEDKTDIHSMNQKAAGLSERDKAKTFIYAWAYGAGDEEIGSIEPPDEATIQKYKDTKKASWRKAKERLIRQKRIPTDIASGNIIKGGILRKRFLKKIIGIQKLIDNVKKVVEDRGYLIGLDGRRLHVRKAYAALNVLLQSAGALIMKKAACILHQDLAEADFIRGIDYNLILNIHDEYQAEVKPELAEQYKVIAEEAIRKAGRYFNFKCELDAEAKIGNNWSETH